MDVNIWGTHSPAAMPRKVARKVRRRSARKARKTAPKRSADFRRDTIPRTVLGGETQKVIRRFGLTRELAAAVVGDASSQMSRLMTGHFADFSADRIAKFLIRLGSDITITLKHAPRLGRRGHVRVKAS